MVALGECACGHESRTSNHGARRSSATPQYPSRRARQRSILRRLPVTANRFLLHCARSRAHRGFELLGNVRYKNSIGHRRWGMLFGLCLCVGLLVFGAFIPAFQVPRHCHGECRMSDELGLASVNAQPAPRSKGSTLFRACVGRFDDPTARAMIDVLAKWVAEFFRADLQQRPSKHVYIRTLPANVVAQIDQSCVTALMIRAAILERFNLKPAA